MTKKERFLLARSVLGGRVCAVTPAGEVVRNPEDITERDDVFVQYGLALLQYDNDAQGNPRFDRNGTRLTKPTDLTATRNAVNSFVSGLLTSLGLTAGAAVTTGRLVRIPVSG